MSVPADSLTARPYRFSWETVRHSLSRVTSGGKFVPCVDGLRFVAIMAVVLYHLNGYLVAYASGFSASAAKATLGFDLLHGAQCGVQIFFAISGFILALPFAREALGTGKPVKLKQYYFRRVTRLEPPFLINLAIIFLLLVLVKKQSVSEMIAPLLATMTYTHNWIYGTMSTVNAVAWSLEIEIQFYVLAPFLARFYFRNQPGRRRVSLAGCICLIILAKTMLTVSDAARFRLGLVYTIDHFLAGILVADLFVFDWAEQPVKRRMWDRIGLLVLLAIFFSQLSPANRHLLPVFSILFFVAAFRGPVTNRLLSLPFIAVTGGMCYSIYLYHFLVISLAGRFVLPAIAGQSYPIQFIMLAVATLPIVFCVCAVFFVTIEKPFMKWRPTAKTA